MSKHCCPSCGNTPTKIETKWGDKFICYKCNLWAWGDAPLVDQATHEARIDAHVIFDKLWKQKHMSRSKAYSLLATHLHLPQRETHIKLFDKATAWRAAMFAKRLLQQFSQERVN